MDMLRRAGLLAAPAAILAFWLGTRVAPVTGTLNVLFAAIDAVLVGIGVAFLVFGSRLLRKAPGKRRIALPFFATAWLLAAGWMSMLIPAIGVLARLVSVAAVLTLAHYFHSLLREQAGSRDDDAKHAGYEIWK